jgi:hypothetical protein
MSVPMYFPKRRSERGNTAAALAALNEKLFEKEICVETDTGKFKFGKTGVHWNDLEYAGGGITIEEALEAVGAALTDSESVTWEIDSNGLIRANVVALFAVASGTDTITATFSPAPVLTDGLELRVRAAAANTGAATFNPNGLGALSVTKQGGTALSAGDIAAAGHEIILRYRASPARYELLNPAATTSGGGSADSRDSWLFG